jgi:hypothetical protein
MLCFPFVGYIRSATKPSAWLVVDTGVNTADGDPTQLQLPSSMGCIYRINLKTLTNTRICIDTET